MLAWRALIEPSYQRFPKDVNLQKDIHEGVRSLNKTPYWLVSKIKEQEKKYKEKKAKKLQEAKIARLENTQ